VQTETAIAGLIFLKKINIHHRQKACIVSKNALTFKNHQPLLREVVCVLHAEFASEFKSGVASRMRPQWSWAQ
jgi:hypothetical protein